METYSYLTSYRPCQPSHICQKAVEVLIGEHHIQSCHRKWASSRSIAIGDTQVNLQLQRQISINIFLKDLDRNQSINKATRIGICKRLSHIRLNQTLISLLTCKGELSFFRIKDIAYSYIRLAALKSEKIVSKMI